MAQAEQLRRVLTRQPFRPFAIRMVNGTSYGVPHPDWLVVPPARRPEGGDLFQDAGAGDEPGR